MKNSRQTSKAALQREGANTVGVPCTTTGTTLAPPTTTTIAMDTVNTTHTTAETEVTERTTATVTTPASNLITMGTTAADTTSKKQRLPVRSASRNVTSQLVGGVGRRPTHRLHCLDETNSDPCCTPRQTVQEKILFANISSYN